MLMALLISLAQAESPEIVIEKRRKQGPCVTENVLGSRIRLVRRCGDPVDDPQAKLDEHEAQRRIEILIQQNRLDHAARVRG